MKISDVTGNESYKWSASNQWVVKVTADGTVKAVRTGFAIVSCKVISKDTTQICRAILYAKNSCFKSKSYQLTVGEKSKIPIL